MTPERPAAVCPSASATMNSVPSASRTALEAPIQMIARRLGLLVLGTIMILSFLAGQARAFPDLPRRFATFENHDPASETQIDHGSYATFLDRYLEEGQDGVNLVRYGAVTDEDHQTLKAYIRSLEQTKVTGLSKDEQFAFWTNLYNALTIDVILDAYPVDSIWSIRPTLFSLGPWGKERVSVEGVDLSLNDIEHGIMRPIWRDPRIHYAVNCASIGCPNLRLEPYTAEGLDEALTEAARLYANHPRGAALEDGRLVVSKIYRWYKEDFGDGSNQAIIDHIREYAEPDLASQLAEVDRIAQYRYDWSLNDASEAGTDRN